MRIIETRGTSILSRMIVWALGCKGSHILFSFDDDKWIVQSNLLGVNIRLYKNFMKGVTIVDSVEYKLDLLEEESIFQALLEQTSEDEYDWPGFAYFCLCALRYKLFKINLPTTNAWGQAHMEICTEMIRRLPPWLTNLPTGLDLGITTPDQAMKILKEANV